MKRLERVPSKYRKKVETLLKALPRLISDQRKKLDLSQEELAEDLNISLDTLKALETGRRVPSFELLCYLCIYFDVDIKFVPKAA